jgi:hypothetical protein
VPTTASLDVAVDFKYVDATYSLIYLNMNGIYKYGDIDINSHNMLHIWLRANKNRGFTPI